MFYVCSKSSSKVLLLLISVFPWMQHVLFFLVPFRSDFSQERTIFSLHVNLLFLAPFKKKTNHRGFIRLLPHFSQELSSFVKVILNLCHFFSDQVIRYVTFYLFYHLPNYSLHFVLFLYFKFYIFSFSLPSLTFWCYSFKDTQSKHIIYLSHKGMEFAAHIHPMKLIRPLTMTSGYSCYLLNIHVA